MLPTGTTSVAEDIITIYKLRWNTETFFGWWKQHLNVYHRLARGPYGMMVHLLNGLNLSVPCYLLPS
ncbi:MAG: transposase [Candidatus Latescibacteria bacterium]|nr:transposase [Candidatus Latescibacterota bacterium]